MLWIDFHSFYSQKKGNSFDEYEDAFSIAPRRKRYREEGITFRAAIADGATEGAFSRNWAHLLVTNYVNRPYVQRNAMLRRASNLAPFWHKEVWKPDLPWYAEQKIARGAFATLLGLLLNKETGKWNAISVGDSCLFHIRANELIRVWPKSSSTEFDNVPVLLSTLSEHSQTVYNATSVIEGIAWPADLFFLVTDALSAWLLQEQETGREPWSELLRFTEDLRSWEFMNWIDELRVHRHLRNDDVTCLICKVNER